MKDPAPVIGLIGTFVAFIGKHWNEFGAFFAAVATGAYMTAKLTLLIHRELVKFLRWWRRRQRANRRPKA